MPVFCLVATEWSVINTSVFVALKMSEVCKWHTSRWEVQTCLRFTPEKPCLFSNLKRRGSIYLPMRQRIQIKISRYSIAFEGVCSPSMVNYYNLAENWFRDYFFCKFLINTNPLWAQQHLCFCHTGTETKLSSLRFATSKVSSQKAMFIHNRTLTVLYSWRSCLFRDV